MSRPVVIGIAGGIGAGKSTVARVLAEAGCAIYDADAEVAALYRREDVLDTVRDWWGDHVVHQDELDRYEVAKIVFEDAAQRTRLEGLLFPLLAERRKELFDRATEENAPAVVIDAPLLFEADLDRECDVVVFIDTPRETRLERLVARSGWDSAELARREKAQLPLDAKRERSDHVLSGDGSADNVKARVLRLLDDIIASDAPGEGAHESG